MADSFPIPEPHYSGFLVLWLSEIRGIHIKSKKSVRIDRCRKMRSCTHSFWDLTLVIVVNSLMNALRYCLRKLLIQINVFFTLLSCIIIGSLKLSVLQVLYIDNFHRMGIIWWFFNALMSLRIKKIHWCFYSKISIFFNVTITTKILLFQIITISSACTQISISKIYFKWLGC